MSNEGFNISLELDQQTGFITGGNPYNCLTWMDKMGSSTHAGTKGIPSTPRAGAPIDMTGLLYYSLKLVQKLHKDGHFSFDGVTIKGQPFKFSAWSETIENNF